MDYKKNRNHGYITLFILVICIVFSSCSDKEKMNTGNTFYIDIVKCPDSLKQKILEGIVGKVSYHKNNKIQIMSLNYVTEDYPDMHYFKNIIEIDKTIKKGTNKIKIEFSGNFTTDSTFYSLQEFKYDKGVWKMTSDIGVIKANSTNRFLKGSDTFGYDELSNQVIRTAVWGTY